MATPSPEIEAILEQIPVFRDLLADPSMRVIHLNAGGAFKFQRHSQWVQGADPLESEQVENLLGCLSSDADDPTGEFAFDGWVVWALKSAHGKNLVFERRPRGQIDTIPRGLVVTLEQAVEKGACGLILGPPSSATEELLLHLARASSTDPAVYVSTIAPDESVLNELTHVHPPELHATRREDMRSLGRLPRVMWQGMSETDELELLFNHAGIQGRWASIVTADVDRTLFRLHTLRQTCPHIDVDLVVSMDSCSEKGLSIPYLARRLDGSWQETLEKGNSKNKLLEAAFPAHGRVQPPGHVVVEEPKRPTLAGAGPLTRAPKLSRRSVSGEFDIAALMESEEEESQMLRQSGEIDLQKMIRARDRGFDDYDDMPPTGEILLEDVVDLEDESWPLVDRKGDDQATNVIRGDRLDRILPMIEAHGDIADIEIGEVRTEQLRQTVETEVDTTSLKKELLRAVTKERKAPAIDLGAQEEKKSDWSRQDHLSGSRPRNIIREEPSIARDDSQRSRSLPRILPSKEEISQVEEKTAEIDVPRALQDLSRRGSDK
ncbi:MAG: hypothetical protein ACNA8W_08375 [Bradymonadaceae bacterium]